jgi:hypothetical protein
MAATTEVADEASTVVEVVSAVMVVGVAAVVVVLVEADDAATSLKHLQTWHAVNTQTYESPFISRRQMYIMR